MYEETKLAVRKAFEISKLLFSMGSKYSKLVDATLNIKVPTEEEVKHLISDKITLDKAIIIELKNRYKIAAKAAGFDEKYGIALLEYISLHKEMSE